MAKYYVCGEEISMRGLEIRDRIFMNRIAYEWKGKKEASKCAEELWDKNYVNHFAMLTWAIEKNNAQHNVIGFCSARNLDTQWPILECFIFPEYRESGYGYDSLNALINHIVQIKKGNVDSFLGFCHEENIAGQRLMAKLNGHCFDRFSLEHGGIFLDYAIARGISIHYTYEYSIPVPQNVGGE